MFSQHSEPFGSPRTVTDGPDGVTENVGLSFLLPQAVPRAQEAMLSPSQTQSTETVAIEMVTSSFLSSLTESMMLNIVIIFSYLHILQV